MVAIAVPITDLVGQYYGALACHGPIQRFNLDDAEGRMLQLKAASAEISASLFGELT
jgi:DNA-binding IclR family transcriptional regulator